jgi:hypothetical protein
MTRLEGEFIGILNYSIMALIQLERGVAEQPDMSWEEASAAYLAKANEAKELMLRKNHDYGEAWRDMRVSSFTDLIIQKLLRVKQIEDNQGKTLVSEGLEANYLDMVNYSVFALIMFMERGNKRIMIKRILIPVIQFLVGGLFIFSGLVKMNDPVGFSFKLEEYFSEPS